jgi:hypothetical protein
VPSSDGNIERRTSMLVKKQHRCIDVRYIETKHRCFKNIGEIIQTLFKIKKKKKQ